MQLKTLKKIFTRFCAQIFFSNFKKNLIAAEKFNWETILQLPPALGLNNGNQIMHFNLTSKLYLQNEQSKEFVTKYMYKAKQTSSDAETLRIGSDSVCLDGEFVELGVCTGKTINFIAALNPLKKIHGFDSFEGLPEDWTRGDTTIIKGTFGYKNSNTLPAVLNNVVLTKGLFSNTLPAFVKCYLKDTPIALLHVDCDLYSSTKTALEILKNNIKSGTIIIFDEFYNYPEFEKHEFKAFTEFLENSKLKAEYLAFNMYHEQVVIKIVDDKKSEVNMNNEAHHGLKAVVSREIPPKPNPASPLLRRVHRANLSAIVPQVRRRIHPQASKPWGILATANKNTVKFIKYEKTHKKENSSTCQVAEYMFNQQNLGIAKAQINGRYPIEQHKEAVNKTCDIIYFTLNGSGMLHLSDESFTLIKNDAAFIPRGQQYWVEGNELDILVISSPKWNAEQYEEVDEGSLT